MKKYLLFVLLLFILMPEVQAQGRIPKVPKVPRVNVPSVKVPKVGRIPYATIPPKTNLTSGITPVPSLSSRLGVDLRKAAANRVLRSQWPNFWLAATQLKDAGQLDSAVHYALALSESTRQTRDEEERLTHVSSRLMACKIYEEMNDSLSAYLLAKDMLKDSLTEQERRIVGSTYAYNGYKYAVALTHPDATGKVYYAQARKICAEILPYAPKWLKRYVESKIPLYWYFEANQCQQDQRFEEALTAYSHACDSFAILGRLPDAVRCLSNSADIYKYLLQPEEAEPLYAQALSLTRQHGLDSLQMEVLQNIWTFGKTFGNMALIRSSSASMDSLAEATGRMGVKYNYYIHKGKEAQSNNQFSAAEGWYKKAVALTDRSDVFGPYGSHYVLYSDLRDCYKSVGRYDDAIRYAQKALDEHKRHISDGTPQYYLAYDDLAYLYAEKGDSTQCELYLDSLFIGLNLCQEPRQQSQMYLMRALYRRNLGNLELALADFKTADSILATKYPQSEDSRVMLLPLMGGTEHELGHNDEAERLYRLYAEQVKNLYGENSLRYVQALTYFANANGFAGHLDSGCQNYTEAIQGLRRIIKTQSPYMTADEREAFWSSLSPLLANMTPYAIKAERCQTPFTVSCYDALVMSKAFLLESECSLADVVRREGTDQDVADYLRLSLMKKQIQDWERNYALYADSLLELNRTADQLAAHLAERCRSFADQTGFMDIDYAAVKQALKKKEVLIDFTDYVPKTQGRQYAAYIIRKMDDYPLLKHLFAERQIDSLGIVRPDMYYDQDYAPDVLNILWEPLKKYVAEGSTVYYVPSQLLFEVALESLPLPDGSLLGDHYKFVRLSSARELVRTYAPTLSADGASAVLYGGLQYDLQAETMVAQAKQYDVSNLLVMRGADVRGDSLYPLPGTRVEVMAIDSILRANRWQVQCRMDKDGTEESFLSMHGHSPRVLQIATHGFYYTPARAASVDYLKGYTDALSLSGLVLSGANTVWCGREVPEGVQDGILTGSEVARLDLSGTDMVVLSACQSAQGQATTEGLYGLQRAFKKAGVGTMVLTLWKVRDAVACEFMKTFYSQLASAACRWNKHKAFDRAKAIIRAQYPDPSCWAAFVMLD